MKIIFPEFQLLQSWRAKAKQSEKKDIDGYFEFTGNKAKRNTIAKTINLVVFQYMEQWITIYPLLKFYVISGYPTHKKVKQ